MEPLFFGENNHLYGVYQDAVGAPARNLAALLCYPVGHEYTRIHRAFGWLSESLGRVGIPSLRFDYQFTGNSTGEFAEARLAGWVDSGLQAFRELKNLSGATRIVVIGLRVGTIVATEIANDETNQDQVAGLVLWESHLSGQVFVDNLLAANAASAFTRTNFTAQDGTVHHNGYAYSTVLAQDLIDWRMPQLMTKRTLVLSSSPQSNQEICQHLGGTEVEPESIVLEGIDNWNTMDGMGGLFLPQTALREVGDWTAAL